MIHALEITGDDQRLEEFSTRWVEQGGQPIDPAYLARCRAFLWIDAAGRVLGGYLLNAAAPFRSLEGPSDEARRAILARLDLDQTFECACLWMLPELRGRLGSMRCWAKVILHLLRFPRRDVLVSTFFEGLCRNYLSTDAELLSGGLVESHGRTMRKFILVLRGKQGLVRAFAGELLRRVQLQVERTLLRGRRRAARSLRTLGVRFGAALGLAPSPRPQSRG